jgi:glucokinase
MLEKAGESKVPGGPYAIGCDIGGTQMRAALSHINGDLLRRADCPTEPERGIDDAAGRLWSLIAEVTSDIDREQIAGIGISAAGPINPCTGMYDHPPNLPGWHGRTMVPYLRNATQLPVRVIHDAHAAAVAEARYGVARGMKDVVYVTVSTGIGGGMISDGVPVNGRHGMAGEIGHLLIDTAGPICNAGCHGCLEVFAAGGGSAAQARRLAEAGGAAAILALAGGDPAQITGRMIYEAAAAGDSDAAGIVETAIDALATGFANILATFDPGVLVVGGSVVVGDETVRGLTPYWDDLIDRVKSRGLLRFRDGVPIVVSGLGDDVGLKGAAAMAFEAADLARLACD